jgi:pectate lyase
MSVDDRKRYWPWKGLMNKKSCVLLIVAVLSYSLFLQDISAQQLAFPTADGFGKYTIGGRGGKVIEVTNLNDAGTGSLRAAITVSGSRTVIFLVSGTIVLNSALKIINDSITIAGQTAPGDGICLRKYQLVVQANQVIIRYLRLRLGNEQGASSESDAVGGTSGKKNIILDHCSASWSTDETLSFYDNSDLTIQWCLVSESLYNSTHPKGPHGYGGIWGGKNVTFHHNLLAHHSSRNPRFCGSRYSKQPDKEIVDFRNNVIYNWGFNSAYGGEGGNQNIVNNYYKPGPATKLGALRYRILDLTSFYYDPTVRSDTVPAGNFYVNGNFVEGSTDASNDNWTYGVQTSVSTSQKNKSKATTPFPFGSITTQPAQEAYAAVLDQAGAFRPVRDTIDKRIVYETRTGTVTYGGYSYPKKNLGDSTLISGMIDTQNDVGGWPVLHSTIPPFDSDHDGMPDDWEIARGLDPNNGSDRNALRSDGYTNLEAYLNTLTGEISTGVIEHKSQQPMESRLLQNFPNPFNPSTTIQYELSTSGRVSLIVYDLYGREIAILVDGTKPAGQHESVFHGERAASGVYFVRLTTEQFTQSIKLLLAK